MGESNELNPDENYDGKPNESYDCKEELQLRKDGVGLSLDTLPQPNINRVDITNSRQVHVGNKIILNGVLHINKLVGDEIAPLREAPAPAVKKKRLIVALALAALLCIIVAAIYFSLRPSEDVLTLAHVPVTGVNSLKIRRRVEWLAQPPTGPIQNLKLPVPLVIITHTASENCTSHPQCMHLIRNIQMLHVEGKNWTDIGYNFLVGGDGYVYEGRGWDKVGAHTYGYNVYSIGIALIGTFINVRPPEKQFIATQTLISEGVLLEKISQEYQLLAHCNVSQTQSPGEQAYLEIKKWPHFSQVPVLLV